MKIVIIGIMGAGKTTIGKSLASRLDYEFIDMDKEIERRERMKVDKIFLEKGEEYFRNQELLLAKELAEKDEIVISTGGGVVLQRELMKHLKKGGKTVYIMRDISEIIKKVNTKTRPLLRDNPEKLYDIMNERKKLYSDYADIIIHNKGTPAEVSSKIYKMIGGKIDD